jgi:hypothetical protein
MLLLQPGGQQVRVGECGLLLLLLLLLHGRCLLHALLLLLLLLLRCDARLLAASPLHGAGLQAGQA